MRKLKIFTQLTAAESQFLAKLDSVDTKIPADTDIISSGDMPADIYLLKKGWAVRYKTLENGARAIIDFILPGDFMNPDAAVFAAADCSVATITEVSVNRIPTERIAEMFNRFPKLAMAFAWCTAREEACLVERLLNIGRRPAYQRLAHFLLELGERQRILGGIGEKQVTLPITQLHLADSLGLSVVHVNRVLRRMREEKLVRLQRGQITLIDVERIEEINGFNANYLHFEEMPLRTAKAFSI